MEERELRALLEADEHHWWYRGRRLIIRAELDRLPLLAGARVLDAGCGSGRTLEDLRVYGEVSGIELSELAAEHARKRNLGDVHIGRVESLPWGDDSFDLVTCLDVLEHTPDDRVALQELRRVTKRGGWLLVTVPAYPALWSTHDVVNHHYRRYTRRTLRRAAVDAAWRVDRITSFNSLLLPAAAAVRVSQRYRVAGENHNDHVSELRVGPHWLNGVLERPLRLEAAVLRRGHTLRAGLSLLAVLENVAGAPGRTSFRG
ncbi:MAG TPA: class I SAM-dependent methyltransferase [Solirubrobacteraceae bacterium]|jgi:SAM-dependent methyltransferase|nr:class I SAM-dependent methyltransferase [Solirubrobacteraceae bacterium]